MRSKNQHLPDPSRTVAAAHQNFSSQRKTTALSSTFESPSQQRLNQLQQHQSQSPDSPMVQLWTQQNSRQQQLMQLMMRDDMTMAQKVMMQADMAAAKMPSKSHAATHLSHENRKETEEEKKHQAKMSNAWQVTEGQPAAGKH